MNYVTIQQIKQAYTFKPYKDVFRVTQPFGVMNMNRYGPNGHTGTDVGENDKVNGDKLYAPYDGVILKANSWAGERIGWETYMETVPMVIDGSRFTIRFGFTHTRGKCSFADGQTVTKGDVLDISGGMFTVNSFWTGPHTHITCAPRYDNGDPHQVNWQPDWQNGHAGYVDPMQLINNNNDMIETIKIKNNPQIFAKDSKENVLYWVGGWNTYTRMLKAGWCLPFTEVDSSDAVIVWEPFGWLT